MDFGITSLSLVTTTSWECHITVYLNFILKTNTFLFKNIYLFVLQYCIGFAIH